MLEIVGYDIHRQPLYHYRHLAVIIDDKAVQRYANEYACSRLRPFDEAERSRRRSSALSARDVLIANERRAVLEHEMPSCSISPMRSLSSKRRKSEGKPDAGALRACPFA